MKYFTLLLFLFLAILSANANAQNRTLGANKLALDDGLGHTLTIQTPVPTATGIVTLPSGGGAVPPAGTVVGQMLRWNGTAWENSPSISNTGSALSNAGSIQSTSPIGTNTPVSGGMYSDNMIQAAGATDINGVPYIQVGNFSVTHPSAGTYFINFPYSVSSDPIVISQNGGGAVSITNLVWTRNPLSILVSEAFSNGTGVDEGFNFIVIGPHN